MKSKFVSSIAAAVLLTPAFCLPLRAAILAYEPFTNAPGSAIIGNGSGFGFNGTWQSNSSSGTATNVASGLSYTDSGGRTLQTSGGAAFFQGLTTASSAMQPVRLFDFSRGTNGTDSTTTWISFLIFRTGPTGTLAGNLYGRGGNVPHDLLGSTGSGQKLAIGNGSSVTSNTVALIPQGSGALVKGATNIFGGVTNFVVVRIDHVTGTANDNAYLFVNPPLNAEPSTNSAGAVSTNTFDFSFDRVRVFAGGQSSAAQPYVEMILDEYRIGETFADVAPTNSPVSSSWGPPVITNVLRLASSVVLSGNGGSNGLGYYVLAATNISTPLSNWSALTTNVFDAAGNFIATNPSATSLPQQFFRLLAGVSTTPPATPPSITTQPTNKTVNVGQVATFTVAASGTAPLSYQWKFNTNTIIAGATGSMLTISSAQFTNAGAYSCVVSNVAGAVTSTNATLTVNGPPSILDQPSNTLAPTGSNATLAVSALGTAPLAYQWYFNSTNPLTGGTSAVFVVTNVQTASTGLYHVVITNTFGSVTSSVAVLGMESLVAGAFYVSVTNGNDSNPGTLASPFKTISKGLSMISGGGMVYLRSGTYFQPTKLSLSGTGGSPAVSKRLWAYPGDTVVVDCTGNTSDGIGISGRYYHLKRLTVMKAGHNGINISGNTNVVEHCVVRDNGNTGLHLTGSSAPGPSGNLILNCDAFLNYDPPVGGNADGFSAKWDIGPGNVFRGCRAWWNSDDGWDLWMGTNPVLIDQSWAFYNGTNYWNDPAFDGNGQGFKLGGNYVGAPHRLMRSVAFRNEASGVDQNNNILGQTIDNNTGWANKSRNFNLNHGTNTTPHIVRNNLSFAGTSGDSWRSGTIFTNNSWQIISSPAAGASDVLSTVESVARDPRNPDGSIPDWPFLRPVPGGRLIDVGVDTGDPFNGTAPDLGAFESTP